MPSDAEAERWHFLETLRLSGPCNVVMRAGSALGMGDGRPHGDDVSRLRDRHHPGVLVIRRLERRAGRALAIAVVVCLIGGLLIWAGIWEPN